MADNNQLQLPGQPQQTIGLPENFWSVTFDGFDGLNTKPTRPAIEDQQCFWLDNWMPLGKNNARTLPDIGDSLYKAPTGDGVAFFQFGNIADTAISVVFLSSGGITQVNTLTKASTTIAPANTILNTSAQIGMAQWGSQCILMCAPQTNGYFMWDGTSFYQAGTVGPQVNITNSGGGYHAVPNANVVGGHGNAVVLTPTITSGGAVSLLTVMSPGSGYTASDYVVVAFSGGGNGTPATAIATASLTATGTVGSISVTLGGSGYTGAVQVAIRGGGGQGATAFATAASTGGPISSVTVIDPGAGYSSTPTVVFTDTGNAVPQANIPIMPFGIQGTGLETYSGHVWVTNGAAPSTPPQKSLIQYSAPGNPQDFSAASGGGSFLATDSFVRVGYHALKQSNGFLYMIGDSSVNYISNVQTSGSPPVTTFTNQNIDPQVGAPWPNSVQLFSRALVFANSFGIHSLLGGAVRKVSSPLDGIYTTVAAGPVGGATSPTIAGITPTGAVAVVFGIHIYCLLMPIIDTYTGAQVNKILCWDGQRWFTYQPSVTMLQLASQEINSVLTAYGTDGTHIYPMFQTPSTAITKVIQSKLWDSPTYFVEKRVQRVLGLFQNNDTNPDDSTIYVDTENQSVSINTANVFGVTWYADNGQVATWYANNGQVANWGATGRTNFISRIENSGVLCGFTMVTQAKDYTLISLMMTGQQYRILI